jgi:cytochrome c2
MSARPGAIRLLVVVVGVVALAAGAWAAHAAQSGAAVSLAIEMPDNPAAGARLFVQKSCVRCHALGADDHGRIGPNLGRIHFPGTALDLAGAFWNHAPVMHEKMNDLKIQSPTLTSREMADLVGFLTGYRYYLTELGGPGNAVAGHDVFQRKGCHRCHGTRDDWNKPAPSLEPFRGRVSAILLAQAMWNHGSDMAEAMRQRGIAWPKFEGAEMGHLLAYLQSGNGGATAPPVYFEPGSPRRGRELFVAKGCPECHAVAGRGGRGGPDLGVLTRDFVGSVTSIAGVMWNHRQAMSAELRRRGIQPVTFSGQEMADVIAYLYFVNYSNVQGVPSRGAEIFSTKCSACHSVGEGRRVGPDLAHIPQLDDPIAIVASMWNHASLMEQELRRRRWSWPRLLPGETADLAAFLLSRQARERSTSDR